MLWLSFLIYTIRLFQLFPILNELIIPSFSLTVCRIMSNQRRLKIFAFEVVHLRPLRLVLSGRSIVSRTRFWRRRSTRGRTSWQSFTRATRSLSKRSYYSMARPRQSWRTSASKTLTGGETGNRWEQLLAREPTLLKIPPTQIALPLKPVAVLRTCFWPKFL